jgi:hypothetical protein
MQGHKKVKRIGRYVSHEADKRTRKRLRQVRELEVGEWAYALTHIPPDQRYQERREAQPRHQ